MTLLVVDLLLAILLIVWSIRRYGVIFNPFTLEVYFVLLFLVVPQLLMMLFVPETETYIYSDLVIFVYIVSVFLGTYLGVKLPAVKGIVNLRAVNFLNIILYGILIIPLVYYFRNFSISFGGIRAFYESVVFTPYASVFELSKYLLFFIILIRILRTRKLDIMTLALMSVILLYGSKFALFDLMILIFIFFEHYGRLTIRKFAVYGFIAAAMLVGYRYYQTLQRDRGSVFETAISYFDLYKNQSTLIKRMVEGDHDYYYGKIYFSSYLKYIPRAIWTSKPKAFGTAVLNYDLFPEYAAAGYMPAFGLGTTYADLGFFSVLLYGLSAGFIRNVLYRIFERSKSNIAFMLFAFPLNFITIFFVGVQVLFEHLSRSIKQRDENQPKYELEV